MSKLSQIEPRALELLQAHSALAGVEVVGFSRGDPVSALAAALARMQVGVVVFLERGRRQMPAGKGPVLLRATLVAQVAFRPALLEEAERRKPLDIVEEVIAALHDKPVSGDDTTRNAAAFTLEEEGFDLMPVDGDESAFAYNIPFSITLRPGA